MTDFLREVRPPPRAGFERRFETPPGKQAQVDFAHFKTVFDDEPGQVRTVWLFAMVLAHSRWLWGRFCAGQNLQTVLRCHIAAFQAMGGVPAQILYDRMKTAVRRRGRPGGVARAPARGRPGGGRKDAWEAGPHPDGRNGFRTHTIPGLQEPVEGRTATPTGFPTRTRGGLGTTRSLCFGLGVVREHRCDLLDSVVDLACIWVSERPTKPAHLAQTPRTSWSP